MDSKFKQFRRNKEIYYASKNMSVLELAVRYKLSQSWVRQIIKYQRARLVKLAQLKSRREVRNESNSKDEKGYISAG